MKKPSTPISTLEQAQAIIQKYADEESHVYTYDVLICIYNELEELKWRVR